MEDFPLHAFLTSLASDGVVLSVRDYDRLLRAFENGGTWTVPRLRNTLTALLARDEDQQRLIGRRFDRFFAAETGLERRLGEIDVGRVRRELEGLPSRSDPSIPPPGPIEEAEWIKQVEKKAEDPSSAEGVRVRWWSPAILVLVLLVGGILAYQKSQPPTPAPICRIQPDSMGFEPTPVGESRQDEFVVENPGASPLVIESMAQDEKNREIFEVGLPDLPTTLEPGGELPVPVTFTPSAEATFSAEIVIAHNAGDGVDVVPITGAGISATETGADSETDPASETGREDEATEEPPPEPKRRLYRNVPYVENVRYDPIQRSTVWQRHLAVSIFLCLGLLAYALYLLRLKRGPVDKAPPLDKNGPMFFHPGTIGGNPRPWLDETTLADLADSMGYFKSEQPGRILNVPASIRATVKSGGIPSCAFYTRTRLRTLLILEDADAEALDWNPLPRELAEGIERYGVPVRYGRFRGTPERFRSRDGHVHYLEDLEDQRHGILMLIFTDGKGFHARRNAFALESLSRWPMKAWMELRERRFWDDTLRLAIQNDIPVYAATPEGVLQAVRRFLTEQGAADRISENVLEEPWLPEREKGRDGAWLEYFLGDALPWAQACSVLQPMPDGLADGLRREFHRDLAPQVVERLYALPNTTRTEAGFRFSGDVQAALKRGLLDRRSEDEQRAVVGFILNRIEEAEPAASENSLAHLTWEATRERVRLEMATDDELKRFGELMQTRLSGFLGDSLEGHGFPDQKDTIPILRKPGKYGALRLKKVRGAAFDVGAVFSWKHWSVAAALFAALIGAVGWTMKGYSEASRPLPNLAIEISELAPEKTPAALAAWVDNEWKIEERGEVESLGASPLSGDRPYRLTLYHNHFRTENEFGVQRDQKTILNLDIKDMRPPCREVYDDMGLAVERCYDAAVAEPRDSLEIQSWKEQLGKQAPEGRVMSVGVELWDGRQGGGELGRLRDRLLETRSVDVMYRISPVGDGQWAVETAVNRIRHDIEPWMSDSQLVWWRAGETPDIPVDVVDGFQRAARIGRDDDLAWIDDMMVVLGPGKSIIVGEEELQQAVSAIYTGEGRPISFLRPLEQKRVRLALTVQTIPENAEVGFLNNEETYHDGIQLPPGRYEIEVAAKGYESRREAIVLESTDQTIVVALKEISTRPVKTEYALTVNTVPKSARVRIMNIAPVYKDDILLTPGRYDIEVSSDGYVTDRKWISLGEEDKAIFVELEKIETGELVAMVEPPDASIQVARPDGSEVKSLQMKQPVELSVGEWLVSARAGGYEPAEQTINVDKDKLSRVSIQLLPSKNEFALVINTVPKTASVKFADGEKIYQKGMQLPPGRYEIEISADGYETARKTVTVKDQDIKFDVHLSEITISSKAPIGRKAGDEWTEPSTGMKFVYVPGGEFEMGCGGEWAGDCDSDERPAHSVRLSGFWLGKYEVTVGEFRQFVSEAKYAGDGQNIWRCDGMSKPENMEQGDRHPAACVSWNEATAFAEWLAKKNDDGVGFRLPTEAEWEFACRNRGENVLYCGGNDIDEVAWYSGYSGSKTHEVGGKKHNGSGIYDMSGNVWEWCQDWYGEYAGDAPDQAQDPTGTNSGTYRVLRGGSWDSAARDCRSTFRSWNGPDYRFANRGFRLAFPAGQ